ncbi:hypothetical protein ALQ10_200026 [Pseudomonas savastanoi pv. glycinea]|uniref:Uncharacterized protein n=1 Tax=Pseudomonas syringae TaxID=317 RepID=A0A2K4X3Y7_PSESX|nr:hypothetical protein ALQ10_200026 [Pseudomonas savastanoi pv. glycinea]SOS43000.1 hypothetical protein CFBP3840_P300055 [Pseudomonas syringae]
MMRSSTTVAWVTSIRLMQPLSDSWPPYSAKKIVGLITTSSPSILSTQASRDER